MVRPHHFANNPETALDNLFQRVDADATAEQIAARARTEFDGAAAALAGVGVSVHVFEDVGTATPNSIFPNNWFSTHHGGRVALYPMFAPNRRLERRADIVDLLKRRYRVQEVIDYSGMEYDGLFLEGTGAMVFDHVERVAYVGNSHRADPILLERFCTAFGYEPMAFESADDAGRPIYHTKVILTIGTEFALICLDAIVNRRRRDEVRDRLVASGRTVLELSHAQVRDFCGNALELSGSDGRVLALSRRAADALTDRQRDVIERSARLLPIPIPTIELEGGSVRCMIADVHLTPR